MPTTMVRSRPTTNVEEQGTCLIVEETQNKGLNSQAKFQKFGPGPKIRLNVKSNVNAKFKSKVKVQCLEPGPGQSLGTGSKDQVQVQNPGSISQSFRYSAESQKSRSKVWFRREVQNTFLAHSPQKESTLLIPRS